MELQELLQKLREYAETGDTEQEAVTKGLNEHLPTVHQAIFNAGFARAKDKAKSEAETLQGQLDAAKAKAKELQGQLDAADDGDEKVEQLRTQVSHWKSEAESLATKLTEKEKEHANQLLESTRETKIAEFQGKLAKRVHPKYAERVGRDPEVKKRLRVVEGGAVELLQPGKDIPVTVPEGRTAVDLLVEEIVKETPAELVLAEGDRGSGVSDTGGGPGGKSIGARFLEQTKERVGKRPNPLMPE